jgi:hypothetical protein
MFQNDFYKTGTVIFGILPWFYEVVCDLVNPVLVKKKPFYLMKINDD